MNTTNESQVQKEQSLLLDQLEAIVEKLQPEMYPDYTADWDQDQLKVELERRALEPDAGISSMEEHMAFFKNNPL